MENLDTELYHYGVKGMKWGVRRAAKLRGSAAKSKGEAKVLDVKAKNAQALGRNRAADSYRKKAASQRRKASDYEKEAKKLENDPAYRDAQYQLYKERGRQRTNKILGAIGGAAVVGLSAGMLKVGLEFADLSMSATSLGGFSLKDELRKGLGL